MISLSLRYYSKEGGKDMLGMNSKRMLVSGKFADEIRERIRRIQAGQLTERDLEEIRKGREAIKNVSIVWK